MFLYIINAIYIYIFTSNVNCGPTITSCKAAMMTNEKKKI